MLQTLHWILPYNVFQMDRKTATIYPIAFRRFTELCRHLIALTENSGEHIDTNEPHSALTKVIKSGHYGSSVVSHLSCQCFPYIDRCVIETHVPFQKLKLSK